MAFLVAGLLQPTLAALREATPPTLVEDLGSLAFVTFGIILHLAAQKALGGLRD